MKRPIYSVLIIEEKLPLLTKAKVFAIVNVSEVFYVVVLDNKSPYLTTFLGPNNRHILLQAHAALLRGQKSTNVTNTSSWMEAMMSEYLCV